MPEDGAENEDAWLKSRVAERRPDVLIIDVRSNLRRETLDELRAGGAMIVCLDDPSDRRLAADLGFYPPAPQVTQMAWHALTGTLRTGWEWGLCCDPNLAAYTLPKNRRQVR